MTHLHIREDGWGIENIYELDVAEAFTVENMPLMWVGRFFEITVSMDQR
jgi:hypothetical protein